MKKSVFVIEDDPKFMGQIKEALAQINPDLEVREFKDLKLFVAWLQQIVDKSKRQLAAAAATAAAAAPPQVTPDASTSNAPSPATAEVPEPESSSAEEFAIDLLICNQDFLKKSGFFGLLKKTQEYFILHKLCSKEAPTAFVLTAFDSDSIDLSIYENQIVSNIIFKPFDPLILREHLRMAIFGSKADSGGEVYKQKTKTKIEMLRDIHLESVSETGFTTFSDRKLQIDTQAKYYGQLFQVGKMSYIHAKAISCEPVAAKAGTFLCEFAYVNIQNAQISQLRKMIKGDKKHTSRFIKLSKQPPRQVYNFIVLSPAGTPSVKTNLESKFKNTKITEYNDFISLMMDLDPGAKAEGADKSKEKFLPFNGTGKILYDLKMNKIVGFDPAAAESATFFGMPVAKAMAAEGLLHKMIVPEDRNKWLELCKTHRKPGASSEIYRFKETPEKMAFIKVISLQPLKHEKLGDILVFECAECSESERVTYLQSQSRFPATVDGVFVDNIFAGESIATRWQLVMNQLTERNKKLSKGAAKLFFVSDKPINGDELIEANAPVDAVFMKPVDSGFFLKTLVRELPDLLLSEEDLEIASIKTNSIVKVGQAVVAEEIAEIGISLLYYRAIEVGNFRKICLWLPHEIGRPEFFVSCIGSEEIEIEDKKKAYICHFIFFAVKDASLKHIRTWIKDYYVATKETEG